MSRLPEIELLFDGSYGDCAKRFGNEMKREFVFGLDDDDWRYLTGECVACSGEGKLVEGDEESECPECQGSGDHEDHDAHDARYETWDRITCHGDVIIVDSSAPDDVMLVVRDAHMQGDADKRDMVLRDNRVTFYTVDQHDGDTFLIPDGMEWSDDEDRYVCSSDMIAKCSPRITVEIEQDFTPVRGNALASGDPYEDREYEDSILARLDSGDTWAWCVVRVCASLDGTEGYSEYLGACSYTDEKEFLSCNSDMVSKAIDALAAAINERD